MLTARSQAQSLARQKLALQPLYLDTETTGYGRSDEIVEIGIIDHDGQTVFQSLVRPLGAVSSEARRIHQISDEMLAAAPRWMTVWPQVEAIIAGRLVAIYNADFDLRLMQQSHAKFRMPWRVPEGTSFFCVMKLYAQFYGEWNSKTGDYRWQSLENAGRQCRIPLPNAHRTIADTLLTRAVLHHIAEAA